MKLLNSLQLKFWVGRRLPVLLQAEVAECGVACIAMLASYWGRRVDLPWMRQTFIVSLKGNTLKDLVEIARGLNLLSRPVKLQMRELPELRLPCILHWGMNHFVVLKRVGRTELIIHDPAVGRRRLSLEEASKHFTGVAMEVNPGSEFKVLDEMQPVSLRALMGRVEGLVRGLGQIITLGLALQVCVLLAPFYLQWVVDNALVASDQDLLSVLGLGFMLLVLLQAAIGAVRSWVATVLAMSLNFQWLSNAFSHLMALPLQYFEKRHLGDVVSRFGSIPTIQQTITTQFVEGIIDGVLVLGTMTVMLLYSHSLTGVAVIAVLVYGLMRWSLFRRLRDVTAEKIAQEAKQQTHFIESVRGVQAIRLFGAMEIRRIGWMNLLADQFNAEIHVARLSISYQTVSTIIFGLERIAVIWLAALAVLDAHFSVGMMFAFLSYKDQFASRLAALVDKLFDLKMLRLHGERVADILLHEAEQVHHERVIDLMEVAPSIELRDVSYRYGDGEPNVLNKINLKIPAGQCVAITGPSGGGKTTMVKIMLGLLRPTEGEVLVGGKRLDRVGLANYRNMVGTVMQDDRLFSGSVGDNISFFDPSPDRARIERCAQLAAIQDEIAAMAMGYNTFIGEDGEGLSGGQRQRIMLARAMYKEPKILILDEASSHLDVGNEDKVNSAIREVTLTRILVAHRPETIAMAERVVVLERGALVDSRPVRN